MCFFTKITFWAACTLIWNGSLRVHEALPREPNGYDPQTTLSPEDIEIVSERIGRGERSIIRILIKSPKEDRVGKYMTLEIFSNDTFLCPVRALQKYIREKNKWNLGSPDSLFFTLGDGRGYTGKDFNRHIAELTEEVTAGSDVIVRSHSLRAGVPSEMAKRGADPEQIQGIGCWHSDAWMNYCKLGQKKRMNISDQLCSLIER